MSRSVSRVPKLPSPSVLQWLRRLFFACKERSVVKDKDSLLKLAGLLALCGPPEQNAEVYHTYVEVFIHPKRRPYWSTAVSEIEATAEVVRRIPAAVAAFTKISGTTVPKSFKLINFVQVAVQLTDPEQYVLAVKRSGLDHFGATFHPNTFRSIQGTLRGVYGGTTDRKYVDDVLSKVRIR